MVATHSLMLPLGSLAPGFSLPDTHGKIIRLEDLAAAPALLVAFICNHCPYVIHIRGGLVGLAVDYRSRGLAVVGINANDAQRYPADHPELMAAEGYPFPYLYDESQAVARSYQAACTPDFFLFDAARRLVYRGQMDGSRPGNLMPVTGVDLRRALNALLAGEAPLGDQKPSLGCSIKWRPGNSPAGW